MIDRLERLGHVARTRDPHDRRRVLLSVTPEAVRLGRAFFGPACETPAGVSASFTPVERDAVLRFLTTAREAFGGS